MKITIIGCGYVGCALARQLKLDGHEVTVTTRSPSKLPFLSTLSNHAVILNANDKLALAKVLQDQQAVILTLAADSKDSYRSTYLETAEALTHALSEASQITQIIYTSSTSVYGDYQGALVNEDSPLMAKMESGQILVETEKVLLNLATPKRSVAILRLGEILGPERRIVDRLKRMKSHALPGNGNSITNLIHLEDIVSGIIFSLYNHLSGAFNFCNDLHVTRKELYDEICAKENLPKVSWDPSKSHIHSGNKRISSEKIKSLGYKFINNSY